MLGQHPMVFSGRRADGCGRVVIKAIAEDSVECKLMHALRGNPELRVVPVIALTTPFTLYRQRRMCALCMPRLVTLDYAMVRDCALHSDVILDGIIRQVLQVRFATRGGSASACFMFVGLRWQVQVAA